MVSVPQLRGLSLGPLLGAAEAWDAEATRLDGVASDADRDLKAALDGAQWKGDPAEAAKKRVGAICEALHAGARATRANAQALRRAHRALSVAQKGLNDALESARKAEFTVRDDASVEWPKASYADQHDTEYEPAMRRAATAVRDRVVAVLTLAAQADQELSAALSFNLAQPDTSSNTNGWLRGSDERGGRRQESDRASGREQGGDGSNDNLNSDWAGRAILERYLTGGGDWSIVNDRSWSDYMSANTTLNGKLDKKFEDIAQEAVRKHPDGGTGGFDLTTAMEIQNGEGMVGYQYLHGTDSTAGGFGIKGNRQVVKLPDGTYEVHIKSACTWNDVMDPNPKYSTDKEKAGIGDVISLGQAESFRFHLTWPRESVVRLDADGNVLTTVSGQPKK
ncbi:hypothetical protein ACFVVA_13195 [Kitasatospora sp. NPDC058048]|uniref:hypothetical protein n=1 Tax=Kitasatospora sp. NPDC058048 TaxID=3346313 RepID=UPI0036DD2133